MPVIDADAHIEEGVACWQFLPERLRPRRPMPVTFPSDTVYGGGMTVWVIDRKVRQHTVPSAARGAGGSPSARALTDVPARLAELDRMGVTVQVVYPSLFLGNVAEDLELETALCVSYNSFLAEACSRAGGRLSYAAVVPWRDPAAAAGEIDRVARLGNCVAVMARGVEWDYPLDHPRFEPIYAALDQHRLTLAVHVGSGSSAAEALDGAPSDQLGLQRAHSTRQLGELFSMYAFDRLLSSTIPDRFERVRFLWLELGCDWLPNALRALTPAGRERAERLLGGRLFFSCEPAEDLEYVIGWVGDRCLVAGSSSRRDGSGQRGDFATAFREQSGLAEQSAERILWENPSRCYNV
ncbi:MAG: amidohydrolase family protein [Chloroflexota bacterium]|nr:amidohydrolase family protein [Dehalococcoidia bacterium]MDW8253438.1 amidohydrolase family protein [Chloroflexota bacterium]